MFFASNWLLAVLAQLPMALYLALLPLGYRATPPFLLVMAGALALWMVGRPQWHSATPGATLTVLSWNLGVDVPHLAQAAEDLQKLDWDIALLQEAGLTATHDVAHDLLQLMPVAHAVRGGYEGELLILSRHYPLRQPRQFLVGGFREELESYVALGPTRLRVANVHLVRREWSRPTSLLESARLRELEVRDLLAQGDFSLIGGDFNLPASTDALDLLRERYQDGFETAGRGFGMSYPQPVPLWRIDHVFLDRSLVVCDCRTVAMRASDHRALLTRLRLPPRATAPAPPPRSQPPARD